MATDILTAIITDASWAGLDQSTKDRYSDKHYETLEAWRLAEIARNTDLVAANERVIAEVFDDWPGSGPQISYTAFEFTGWTNTDSTRCCIIRPAPGNEWNAITKTGARLTQKSSDAYYLVVRADQYFYIEDCGIDMSGASVSSARAFIAVGDSPVWFDRCHFLDSPRTAGATSVKKGGMRNCLIECADSYSLYGPTPANYDEVTNCTIIMPLGMGSYNGDIGIGKVNIAENNVIYNENTKVTYSNYTSVGGGQSNAQNANGSDTAPGLNPYNTVVKADFINYDGGDYRLSPTSALKGLGANLAPPEQSDIFRNPWPIGGAGAWDIGCHYEEGGGVAPTPKSNALLFGQDF